MLISIIITSIGRFAVDREFVNIENPPQDCAQDHQEDPQGHHFWAKMVPKIAKRSPKETISEPRLCPRSPRGPPRGPFLGQDVAQDRQEESQGDHFWAKIVPKIAAGSPKGTILGLRWCLRSPRGGPRGPFLGRDCAKDLRPSFFKQK